MSRTRYRYDKSTGKLVEIEPRAHRQSGPFFMPDITEFVSPINGEAISSRPQLRAHEIRHGVRQCGELRTVSDYDNTVHNPYRSVFDD